MHCKKRRRCILYLSPVIACPSGRVEGGTSLHCVHPARVHRLNMVQYMHVAPQRAIRKLKAQF